MLPPAWGVGGGLGVGIGVGGKGIVVPEGGLVDFGVEGTGTPGLEVEPAVDGWGGVLGFDPFGVVVGASVTFEGVVAFGVVGAFVVVGALVVVGFPGVVLYTGVGNGGVVDPWFPWGVVFPLFPLPPLSSSFDGGGGM